MSKYYNPASDLEEGRVGRPLVGTDYTGGLRQMREGEHLYALCDRLIFKQAVCVDKRADYDEFYSQYRQGNLMSFQLYALKEETQASD